MCGGGGGGGGKDLNTNWRGGPGGTGRGACFAVSNADTTYNTTAVNVGNGGGGGASSNNTANAGAAGTATSFCGVFDTNGGSGGNGGKNASGNGGAAGNVTTNLNTYVSVNTEGSSGVSPDTSTPLTNLWNVSTHRDVFTYIALGGLDQTSVNIADSIAMYKSNTDAGSGGKEFVAGVGGKVVVFEYK